MIFINPNKIHLSTAWINRAIGLTQQLIATPPENRATFIAAHREETWGSAELLEALQNIVGNKCWYSEVYLEGADPNVDHFRPKGRVVEIDNETLEKTGNVSQGYWWLAFEPMNYRLSSMHSNQRRVDTDTEGGKSDFFPLEGQRAAEYTAWGLIAEEILPFDPCSAIDVARMWFEPDGNPGYSEWRREPTEIEQRRMKATIWLFHLNKKEIAMRRADSVEDIRKELKEADIFYQIWQPHSGTPDLYAKNFFESVIARIKAKIEDRAIFAGAKRCAVQLARAKYPWIDEFAVI